MAKSVHVDHPGELDDKTSAAKSHRRKGARKFFFISGMKARQGYELEAIRYVLYISTLLAVVSMIVVYAFFA